MGVQTAILGGIVGEALGVGFIANLSGLGHQTTHIVIDLRGAEDGGTVVFPLAVDQAAQGIVIVQVFGLLPVLCGGDAVQLSIAGVGVGQRQAVGIGDGFRSAQQVIGIGCAEAVVTAVGLADKRTIPGAVGVGGQGPGAHLDGCAVAKSIITQTVGLAAAIGSVRDRSEISITVIIQQCRRLCNTCLRNTATKVVGGGSSHAVGRGDRGGKAPHDALVIAIGVGESDRAHMVLDKVLSHAHMQRMPIIHMLCEDEEKVLISRRYIEREITILFNLKKLEKSS